MTGTKTDAEEDGIRIAFLILCHADPVHIARLVGKLIQHYRFEAFIHVDDKVNIAEFSRRLPVSPRVHLSKIRFPIFWGGFNSVEATLALMKLARETREFDRYVLLQGADYPLMSNEAIVRFFSAQASTEFIRACSSTKARRREVFEKSRFVLLFDRPSFPKKVVNKISRVVGLRLKRGLVSIEGRRGEVFWGSALWALTGACVDHILATAHQQTLRRFFATAFTADETFFHTIVFNSTFAARTPAGGAEPEAFGLTEWRNLHYFEYPKEVLILTEKDYVFLRQRPEMFIRKVSTTASTVLLDRLDVDHAIERSMARAIQSCRI